MAFIYHTWAAEVDFVLFEYGGFMPRPLLQSISGVRFFDAPAEILKAIGQGFSLEQLGEESRLARHFWDLAKPYNALEKLDYELITFVAGSRMQTLCKRFNQPGGNKALAKRFGKLAKGLDRHLRERIDRPRDQQKSLEYFVRDMRLFAREAQDGAVKLGGLSKQPLNDVLKLYDRLEAELLTRELLN